MTVGRNARLATIPMAALLFFSCARADEPAPNVEAAGALPPGHVPIPGETAPSIGPAVAVTVLETMDSGGYTYSRVATDDGEAWVAGPVAEIEVGQTVAVTGLMQMDNFTSTSLNRTFDVLYFASSYQDASGASLGGAIPSGSTAGGADMSDASRGTVVERLAGGGYIYLHVAVDSDSVWLAGPSAEVTEGQTVARRGGMLMTGFTSSSLDRTFDEIFFVDGVMVVN
jgi:hypothetical protein